MTGTTPVRAINGTTVEACRPNRGVTRKSSDTIGAHLAGTHSRSRLKLGRTRLRLALLSNTMTPICHLRMMVIARRQSPSGRSWMILVLSQASRHASQLSWGVTFRSRESSRFRRAVLAHGRPFDHEGDADGLQDQCPDDRRVESPEMCSGLCDRNLARAPRRVFGGALVTAARKSVTPPWMQQHAATGIPCCVKPLRRLQHDAPPRSTRLAMEANRRFIGS